MSSPFVGNGGTNSDGECAQGSASDLAGRDQLDLNWKRVVQGRSVWVSPEPSSEEVKELVQWFLEVVELLEEDVRVE